MTFVRSLTRRAFLAAALSRAARRGASAPSVEGARRRSVDAFGTEAAEPRHLEALLALSVDPRAGEIGRRLAARSLDAGVSAVRAAELVGHLRARRGPVS